MNPTPFLKFSIFLAVFSLSFCPGPAHAQDYIVDWSGSFLDHLTSAQKLDLGTEEALSDKDQQVIGVGFSYNDQVPKTPKNAHYLQSRPSALIYGVLQFTNPLAASTDNFAVKVRPMNQVPAVQGKNAISLVSPALGDGSEAGLKGLLFWKKSEFQGGFNEMKKLTWASIISLSLNINRINNFKSGRDSSVRFAILSGGNWYLSETEAKGGLFTVNDPQWGKWSVEQVPLPLPDAPSEYPVKSSELSDITAVGIYFDVLSLEPDMPGMLGFNSFQVEGNPPVKK